MRTLCGIILAALFAAPAFAEDIGCAPPFDRGATHASLAKAFGKANVATETIGGAEGETLRATVIYPKESTRRIEVVWFDEKGRRQPSAFRVRDGFKGTIAGIALGTSLAAVEKRNGRPITLYGFDWDYGGYASDYGGGALSKLPGGCVLSLRFEPGPGVSDAARAKAAGDGSFSSASAAMKGAKPVVVEMSLGWGKK